MAGPALPSRRSTRPISAYDRLRPDGRWFRVLTALGTGPADIGTLLESVDQGRYPLWRERRKIRTALFDMADLDWVAATPWGWVRTLDGGNALAEVTPAPTPNITPNTAAADDRSPAGKD